MKATNRFVLYFSVMSIFIVFACSFVTGQPPTIDSTATSLPTKIPETPQTLISPNSLPLPNGLILKSATDTERDLSGYQVAYLEDAADGFSGANQSEIEMYFGENHNFSVHVNSSKGGGLVWATGWCAQGQETLSQNLKKIQFEMAVNGQPVDLNQVYRSDNEHSWHTAGDFCLFYRIIVSGLPSGTTTLTSKTIINEPVNDGHKDYPTGELTRTYEVINSAGASQSLSGTWVGEWTTEPSNGYVYACEITLTISETNIVDGYITWTLKESPKPSDQMKIGTTGIEYISGTYNPQTRLVTFNGIRDDDPNKIIGLDTYKLTFSVDGNILSGETENHGDWKGRITATRKP